MLEVSPSSSCDVDDHHEGEADRQGIPARESDLVTRPVPSRPDPTRPVLIDPVPLRSVRICPDQADICQISRCLVVWLTLWGSGRELRVR